MSNPLDVQELVEYCFDFLHGSKSDLKACALVCRGWVYAAQSQLFAKMDICDSMVDQHRRVAQLLEISQSPHILALVSRLEINLHYLASESFLGAITQFTRLKEVRISGNSMASTPGTASLAVGALLSLTTVQRVELHCAFPTPSAFLQIWGGCSENVKHLELGSVHVNDFEYDWASSPVLLRSKVKLASLRVLYGDFILPWLTTDACPFAFSQLTSLTVCALKEHLIDWSVFQPKMIERLEIGSNAIQKPINLGPFTRLRHLVLQVHGPRNLAIALTVLATIPPANHISRITLDCTYPSQSDIFTRLDDLLFGMPLPELVEVEFFTEYRNVEEPVKQALPKLHACGLLGVKSWGSAYANTRGFT
ncbi:NmrA domain-containing protein [Mycena venus]|uniref:NmrA domain-containing protein n=1 Tax=Mycena venus TaxID=2733690 RepID=A0A8H7CHI7_9AGAR|nr:NmrA domain-containing protein [Mycena venus]